MEGSIMAPEYEYVMPDNENANVCRSTLSLERL